MKFDLFQIHLTNDEHDAINKLGWDLAYKVIPRVRAYLDKEKVSSVREAWGEGIYEHVATIDARDLEDAFHIGNVGPEEKITRYSRMHSVSVGDVLVDSNGACHLVSGIGFEVLI